MKNASVNWIILISLSVIWGSSFILMKLAMYTSGGVQIFTDTQVASIRMVVAGLVLLPLAIIGIKRIQSFKDFLLLAVVGATGNFIPSFLFTFAETELSSGYAGMLNSFTPIFAILIGYSVFKNTLTQQQILGVVIGTAGIIALTLAGTNLDGERGGTWVHVCAIIVATLCYAISLNVIKYTLQKYKSTDITAVAMLIILIPSIVSAINSGSLETISTNEYVVQGMLYIAILSIVGTAFAVILLNVLIARSSVLFASSVTYLIPIVAVLIGLAYNEVINGYQILSMTVVLMGVFIANLEALNKRKNSKKRT